MAELLPASAQHPARHPHLLDSLIPWLLLLTLGWGVITGFTLWHSYRATLKDGETLATTQNRILEERMSLSLRLVEMVASDSGIPNTSAGLDHELSERMAAAIDAAPFLRSVSVVNAQGQVEASTDLANRHVQLDLQQFYPNQQPNADILRIGLPWAGHDLKNGHPITPEAPPADPTVLFVPVLHKLPGPGPTRWLLVSLNPDHFILHAGQLVPHDAGHAQWLRYDGVLLFSTNPHDLPGNKAAAESWLPAAQEQQQGVLPPTLADGLTGIGIYRSSNDYPFLTAVQMRQSALLADWRQTIQNQALVLLPVLLALVLVMTIARQRRRALLQRKAEEDEAQRLAASVFTHAREGILITDPNGTLIDVNDAFTEITGYSRHEAIGHPTRLLNSGRQSKDFYQQMWQTLLSTGQWAGELWNRRKSGEVYAQISTISAVYDNQGQVQHYVALISDISQQKENEQRLQHIAHYDALTGLPNRVLLADRLRQAMTQSLRRNTQLALVFLDLDGFKTINDQYGHGVGDKLLIALANRMKQSLREGDTLARLGGDEFVALMLDLTDHEACLPVLDRLRAAAAQPVISDGMVLQVSASLGVAFYPQNEAVDADQLLRQADQAMYQAKLAGKNRFHVFDADQDRDIRGRNESLESIRLGLQQQEFRLHYQPKVNMRTGQVLGVEALIRWQHPEQGLLPPARFLPALEGHPLALELGYWVLGTALKQIEVWQDQGLNTPISVNVDAQLLQQDDFVTTLQALLSQHPKVRPGHLELEVLETSALDDMDRVAQVIEACQKLGVYFALDDFGTGYSSLTYLRHLPTRQLKIDQSFVRDMLDDPDDLAILDGVIGLAIAFRRDVIAEGVETDEHGRMLLRLGCDWAQGYVIAKPMPAEALPAWALNWTPPASWMNTPRSKREDLPLLFAAVEHRAWINGVVQHLLGQRDSPPVLDPRECRLGHWIEHEGGRTRHGVKLQFSALETLHLDIHRLVADLIEAVQQHARDPDWLAQNIQQLHAARDELLSQLVSLQGARPTPGSGG